MFDLVNCCAEQVDIMACKVLVKANLPAHSSPGSHVPPVHDRILALPLPVCFAGLE